MDNWIWFVVAFGSGAMLLWPALKSGSIGGGALNANAAVMLMNRDRAIVLDVSEPQEFAQGHIVGAKNLPLEQVQAKLEAVVKNKQLPLILVCPSGARAARAIASVKKLGYENVQALAGGLQGWRAAGLPLEKA